MDLRRAGLHGEGVFRRGWPVLGALLIALFAAPLVSALPRGASRSGIEVYPRPGTDTAHPATTVSIRGVVPERLGEVTVAGTSSGVAAGRLRRHRDRAGASFVPERPFTPGERVVVDAEVPLGRDDRVTFQIGAPGAVSPTSLPPAEATTAPPEPTRFRSAPSVVAPTVEVEGRRVGGLVLSTPQGTPTTHRGAMITDADGDLVWWYSPADERSIANLFVTRLHGQPVLTWFEGEAPYTPGWFLGEWVVVDRSYRQVARIRAGNGLQADVHELALTDRGTAWVVAYQPLVRDAVVSGGKPDSVVLDGVIQEVDVETGDVLFEWHSLDHVPLEWSVLGVPESGPFDYAHINSVQEAPDGDLLVVMRHTSMVAEIDRATGRVEWALGGPGATVTPGDDPGVRYPHHARWVGEQLLSVFDNGVGGDPPASRGVVYALDEQTRRATPVTEYTERPAAYTATQGSLQLLGGTAVVGWGELGTASVFSADGGRPLGRLRLSAQSYRILVDDWEATPAAAPQVVVDGDEVAVSWNGATQVATWELRSLDAEGVLRRTLSVPSRGFETVLPLDDAAADAVTLRALDAAGAVLVDTAVTALDSPPRR